MGGLKNLQSVNVNLWFFFICDQPKSEAMRIRNMPFWFFNKELEMLENSNLFVAKESLLMLLLLHILRGSNFKHP